MKPTKTNKFSKSAKAALPIFALFGGQGFASSRNPLSLQSSKKLAGKSVVYINNTEAPLLPTLDAKKSQKANSPFAAFTSKTLAQTKKAQLDIHSETIEFLKLNSLIDSIKTKSSTISGNTVHRKSFSDDWQWSTRLNPFPPTTSTQFVSSCTSNATYSGLPLVTFSGTWTNGTYYCYAYSIPNTGLIKYVSNTNPNAILATCQAMHKACDGLPLPVELMKFDIE